jgi:enoyl-CoA hydratase/carnithine racemase
VTSEPAGTISIEIDDGIAVVTLDRPDKLNALTSPMYAGLSDAFDRVDHDDQIRAVVVTGRGRGFCAGADLSAGSDAFRDQDEPLRRDRGGVLALRLFSCTKPIIAAVNGPAVGVGATMMLPMDVRLASTEARFGFVFARRGIVPEACSSWFLPRLVGMSQAAEWVYSGKLLGAEEAYAGGLVRSVHSPETLITSAMTLAHELTDGTAPVSVALSRQLMWRMLTAPHPMAAHRAESRAISERSRSADVREGASAFRERRAPQFADRVSSDLPDVFPDWKEPEFF